MRVPEFGGRYEVKLVCHEEDLALARAWIRLHPVAFGTAYPPRYVNSLYFDTVDAACLEANVNGVEDRAKLRFRWYGDKVGPVTGQLEHKRKISGLGWKEVVPIAVPLDLRSAWWGAIWHTLWSHCGPRFTPWLASHSQPMLIVRYLREYYASADGLLRITLDSRIESYEQVLHPVPNLTRASPPGHQIVLEIKAHATLHRRVSDALNSFTLPVSRHSKYVTGLLDALCFA